MTSKFLKLREIKTPKGTLVKDPILALGKNRRICSNCGALETLENGEYKCSRSIFCRKETANVEMVY